MSKHILLTISLHMYATTTWMSFGVCVCVCERRRLWNVLLRRYAPKPEVSWERRRGAHTQTRSQSDVQRGLNTLKGTLLTLSRLEQCSKCSRSEAAHDGPLHNNCNTQNISSHKSVRKGAMKRRVLF